MKASTTTTRCSGGINPDHLPRTIVGGKCTPIYPHERVRVNTVFELIVAAGLKTAYTYKHSRGLLRTAAYSY